MQQFNNYLRPLLLVIGLVATSTAFCGSSPQSYLSGTPQTKNDSHLYPIQIVSIDGLSPHDNPIAITPGPHWLEIQTAPTITMANRKAPTPHTYVFRIEPCTRYFFAAHKDLAGTDNWKLVVDHVEEVKGCDPAEELKKFPDPSQAAPKASGSH